MVRDMELFVPEEITTNILKRLPVKSLIRFQCVCQEWNNLIKTQSFITHHLHHSSSQNPFLIIQSLPSGFLPPRLHVLDSSVKLCELQKSPPILDSLHDFKVVGSCNGLLLLENIECNIFQKSPPLLVWNPATQQVGRVPLSTMLEGSFCNYSHKTGFGFSPILNDYVIVRTYSEDYHEPVVLGEVFSLSRWSWKEVDVGGLEGVRIYLSSINVTVDGFIHWTGLVEKEHGYGKVIVSFDIVNEVFTSIPTPDLPDNTCVLITINENKVALLCMIWQAFRLGELWELDEGSCASGTTSRWNKRYDIRRSTHAFDACTVWRNNIVGKDGEDVLCWRDLLTNEVKRSSITYPGRLIDCYHYVESLVSFGKC